MASDNARDVVSDAMASNVGASIVSEVGARADAARAAQRSLANTTTAERDGLLGELADALDNAAEDIARANQEDMEAARTEGMAPGKLDRLLFDAGRVHAAASGVRHVASLPDPLGQVVRGYRLDNGLRLEQVRVPLGVIGMIYEARPNVTVDVVSLCLKSGNAVLLRGGHAARRTNEATLRVMGSVLDEHGWGASLATSVDDLGRAGAEGMMRAYGHIDVLIPRGGAGLIQSVVRNSIVPVIETGAGNVHIYVDRSADLTQAIPIILNAKTQRVGVCNAAEKLIVDREIASRFLPYAARALCGAGVEVRADSEAFGLIDGCGVSDEMLRHADPSDWDTEYLAMRMGVHVVSGVDEAIEHINAHSTGHTESIIAQDYRTIEKFTSSIDSAVVMVNASTRFTDGGVFGFGAELGISTQKLHARGPMGLQEMTTTKWIGYGDGQVRP